MVSVVSSGILSTIEMSATLGVVCNRHVGVYEPVGAQAFDTCSQDGHYKRSLPAQKDLTDGQISQDRVYMLTGAFLTACGTPR